MPRQHRAPALSKRIGVQSPASVVREDDHAGQQRRAEVLKAPSASLQPQVDQEHVGPDHLDLLGQRDIGRAGHDMESLVDGQQSGEPGPGDGARGGDQNRCHGTVAVALLSEPRKRTTRLSGTARARPPAIMALMPMTRPRASASGPPELPGASLRSAWIRLGPAGRRGPIAWMRPAVTAPASPSGLPTAITS